MWSVIGLPKTIIAGDRLFAGSGVFLCTRRALANLSVSRSPFVAMLSCISLLALFTPTSALLLDRGKYAELMRCVMPQGGGCKMLTSRRK